MKTRTLNIVAVVYFALTVSLAILLGSCSGGKKYVECDAYGMITKEEQRHINNIKIKQRETVESIVKNDNGEILVCFPTAKYLLADGYTKKLWILSDDDITWEDMGDESY